jgi:hypothetical protein
MLVNILLMGSMVCVVLCMMACGGCQTFGGGGGLPMPGTLSGQSGELKEINGRLYDHLQILLWVGRNNYDNRDSYDRGGDQGEGSGAGNHKPKIESYRFGNGLLENRRLRNYGYEPESCKPGMENRRPEKGDAGSRKSRNHDVGNHESELKNKEVGLKALDGCMEIVGLPDGNEMILANNIDGEGVDRLVKEAMVLKARKEKLVGRMGKDVALLEKRYVRYSSKENNKAITDNKGGMFSAALKQLEDTSSEPAEGGSDKWTGGQSGSSMVKAIKQPVILSTERLEEISQDFLYVSDGNSFYERLPNGIYAIIRESHLGSKLKQRFHLSSLSPDSVILSPTQQGVMYIHDYRRCDKAIQSLAGYLVGTHIFGNERILIKSNLQLMLPKEGAFATIMKLLTHVFGNDEPHYQLDRFLTWLQHAYGGAYEVYGNGKDVSDVCLTGLALILCGKSQVGKSYITNLITKIFGGIVGQPFKSMTGKTEFNADCAKAIHLSIDDQTGTRTYEQRKDHGQRLKAMLSGSAQWIQAKHVDAFTAPLYQRITYSFNSDRDSFSTFPALSDGVRERILALLANPKKWIRFKNAISREERNFLDRTITNELPGFLYHLMNKYIPPEWCITSSFGCKEFIHPDIERQVEMGTPESTLKCLILDYLQSSRYLESESMEGIDFSGNANTLLTGMLESSAHREGLRTFAKNVISFGMRLGDLCAIYPRHFRKIGRQDNCQNYDISVGGFQPIQGQFDCIKSAKLLKR